MSAPFPVIVCGATTDDVESEIGKALLTEMLSNEKLIQADWSGASITGVPVYNSCYANEEELSSDICGALELFKRRTGLIGAVFVCTNFLTSVI
jgi:hypothetical protein